MSLGPPSVSGYFEALALLNAALAALDTLGEGIAAAHLCSVIDIVSARVAQDDTAPH